MKKVLRDVDTKWQRRKYGTPVGEDLSGRKLTHIAFVDDITLVAHSWATLKRMILELRECLAVYGLRLHPSKCKLQCNDFATAKRGDIEIADGFSVHVLPEGQNLKVLGTMLCLETPSTGELRHRIACAWGKFHSLKKLLLHKDASVKKRLKLFDATVGTSALWCAESWTLREQDCRFLRTAQNKMLRRIVQVRMSPQEDYVSWIQRATRRARKVAADSGVKFWDKRHLELKWFWAGHVARRSACEWLWRVTFWRDHNWT